ncbi:MAG: two-component system, chemotaxis family, protein-glutamate methylesterase/glutaminase [Pseudomonadota bacterium]|nr:two-component system, chemotaxis family, protein-glutamate methylesterase/glutaminase [Pseudomonadota bacterium]
MAEKIRILLVDDSAVIRRLLTDVLSGDPQLEVIGIAQNGQIALEKLPVLNPDIVILDVEMPVMDGLETLTEIRKRQPRLPIIMFSSITERGALVTLEALGRGANDYITKPANTGNMTASLQRVRDELIPRIKVFCRHLLGPALPAFTPIARSAPRPESVARPAEPVARPAPTTPLNPFATPAPIPRTVGVGRQRIELVAIGVSTGGPNALAALLPRLPANFPVPIVIVQHMPPIFTRLLAERLTAQSTLPVAEAASGEVLQPGHIRLAPGGSHLVLERQVTQVRLQMNQDPPENSCRPSVDVLFRSVATAYRGNVLAVVLTGMGNDGLRGCEAIRQAGGQILVQDEASSVVWGMPGFVARAGLADAQIALNQMAGEIMNRVRTLR